MGAENGLGALEKRQIPYTTWKCNKSLVLSSLRPRYCTHWAILASIIKKNVSHC